MRTLDLVVEVIVPEINWLSIWYGDKLKVRKVIKRIEADGWFWVRTTGDHRQFHHPTKPGTVTVAGKLNDDMPAGTLNSVLKQAGLK